jgi:hypothetical protein
MAAAGGAAGVIDLVSDDDCSDSQEVQFEPLLFRLSTVPGLADQFNRGTAAFADLNSCDWSSAVYICFMHDGEWLKEQCPRLMHEEVSVLLISGQNPSPAKAQKALPNAEVRVIMKRVLISKAITIVCSSIPSTAQQHTAICSRDCACWLSNTGAHRECKPEWSPPQQVSDTRV